MPSVRRPAQIDAPVERVWELVGDPNRHPEWWPRAIEAGSATAHRVFDRLAGRRCYTRWLGSPARRC